MQSLVGPRLSLMMFLQFFIWGAWWVTLALYMDTERIGMGALVFLAYLSQPIAAIVSPFFLGMVADRFFPSEKVLGVLHLLGAALLLCVPFFGEMDNGQALFITFIILNMLCYMPTIGLTNTVAFKTMTDPEKQFPLIRVWGTIGWIVAGLVIGLLFAWILGREEPPRSPEHTTWPFFLAVGAGLIMGVYSFTLPHTPPPLKGKAVSVRQILGLDAVKQLSSKSFWVFMISSLLICIPLAGYYNYAGILAGDAGMERPVLGLPVSVAAWMTTGQMMEVLFMLLMPLAFAKLGVKWMLLVGMGAWVLRYLLFAFGAPDQIFWMIWFGILLHGICYDFFFVTGMVYVEKKATPEIRAQAQGFLVTMTLGVGMFIGMIVLGPGLWNWMVEPLEPAERLEQAYLTFWLVPAVLALIVMIGFAILFHDPKVEQEVMEHPPEDDDVAEAAAEEEQP